MKAINFLKKTIKNRITKKQLSILIVSVIILLILLITVVSPIGGTVQFIVFDILVNLIKFLFFGSLVVIFPLAMSYIFAMGIEKLDGTIDAFNSFSVKFHLFFILLFAVLMGMIQVTLIPFIITAEWSGWVRQIAASMYGQNPLSIEAPAMEYFWYGCATSFAGYIAYWFIQDSN